MQNVMIDIETLSTRPDAVILSIGAVYFDLDTGKLGETFYQPILKHSQPLRHVDLLTVEWWNRQHEEVRKVFKDEKRKDIKDALVNLQNFFGDNTKTVWAQGPQFDIVILEDAFRENNIGKLPWKFWNVRDSRTVIQLASQHRFYKAEKGSHGALDDAITQVNNLCAAWKLIQEK